MRYEFDNQQVCSSKDIDNYGIKCDCCGGKFQSVTYVDNKAYCVKCYREIFGNNIQQNEINNLKQQIEEQSKEIERLKFFEKVYYQNQLQANQETMNKLLQSAYQSPIAVGLNQMAINVLEGLKDTLKNKTKLMNSEEHNYSQRVISWYDFCDQVNNQIKKLEGK